MRSTDRGVIDTVRVRTTSGGMCINDNAMHLANHELPFGGVGRSGMGACVCMRGVRVGFSATDRAIAALVKAVVWQVPRPPQFHDLLARQGGA